MPLELTASRQASERPTRGRWIVLALALALTMATGCSAASVIRGTPDAAPTVVRQPSPPRPTPRLLASPIAQNGPIIERVSLATAVDAEGKPREELSVVPEQPGQVFLSVQATGLAPGSAIRAVWFEADQIIGQSDLVVGPDVAATTWLALGYRPVFPLKPNLSHAVELLIDGKTVDRYAFRVGVGAAEDVIAEGKVGTGTNANAEPVGVATQFRVDTQQLVLWARISNNVDPTGMTFASTWRRGGIVVAQIGPDGGQPQLPPDPTPAARRMTFTYVPQGKLAPGNYDIALFLNGIAVESYTFRVTVEQPASPTASPSPQPANATATPTPSTGAAKVGDVVVVTTVDDQTQAPASAPITGMDVEPATVVQPWLAINVAALTTDDTLAYVIYQGNVEYDRHDLPSVNQSKGWVATRLELDTPTGAEGAYEYTIDVYLNGAETRSISVRLSLANAP